MKKIFALALALSVGHAHAFGSRKPQPAPAPSPAPKPVPAPTPKPDPVPPSGASASKGRYDNVTPGFYLGHFDAVGALAGCRDMDLNLYRGGRPDLSGSTWSTRFQKEGIDYVLDLRSEANSSSEQAAIKAGLGYIQIPLRTEGQTQVARMKLKVRLLGQSTSVTEMDTVDATIEVLKLVNQLSQKGHRIYIHCAHGEDRTGIIVGLLRKCANWRTEFRRYGGSDYAPLTLLRSQVEARSTEY